MLVLKVDYKKSRIRKYDTYTVKSYNNILFLPNIIIENNSYYIREVKNYTTFMVF